MWIVAVAWIYVVGLMAVTEPTVVAGIMTFFLYCMLPLSILYYLTGSRRRRARRERLDRAGAGAGAGNDNAGSDSSSYASSDDGPPSRIDSRAGAGSDSGSDSGSSDSGSSSSND